MERIHNFSAGPAALPREVLEQASDELMNWNGCGMSVMEMSHRGKEFSSILEAAESDLRMLLGVPSEYRVLFLQGGATLQFAQVPLNLLAGGSADYVVTGEWSRKAYNEARRLGTIRQVVSTEADDFTYFPDWSRLELDPDAAYLHLCSNETIRGVELFDFDSLPKGVPVVADMSSHILSRPMDVTRFGLIYAGAQKNIGPAGICLVLVHEDLLGRVAPHTPTLLDYTVEAENHSMLNTPPTFAIYMAGLVFKWLIRQGGLEVMERINIEKARLLYEAIDRSGFYQNPVQPAFRSRMNVPFTLHDPKLDERFIAEAKRHGILQIKGHKSVGGMRASIYNAMTLEGVHDLVAFMADFEQKNG